MTRRGFLLALASRKSSALSFSGTFLQLHDAHRDWTPEQWTSLFADFARLGLGHLVVQWTEGFVELLPRIFQESAAVQMRVELGLTNEARFWRETPQVFDELRRRNEALIRLLKPYSSRPEFAGWYITEEIDDVRWRNKKTRKQLAGYLKFVRKQLKRSPVRVSAFSNGSMPPAEFTSFLREILRESKIDGVLFQDSIGAKKLSLDSLPGYYGALRAGLGTRVEPVIEIFDQVREDPFEARPAPMGRIQRQLELARVAGFSPPVVFSVPEYRTPELFSEFGRNGTFGIAER